MSDIILRYREDKTTQATSLLLRLADSPLNVMKIIKLLYFSDRHALLTWGRPITYDSYVSMPHGPVLSFTLDKINATKEQDDNSYWNKYISEREKHEVCLLNKVPNDQLCQAEEEALKRIWGEYGKMNQYQISDLSHELPEWKDPEGSSRPIAIEHILLSGGLSKEDVSDVLEDLKFVQYTKELLCD